MKKFFIPLFKSSWDNMKEPEIHNTAYINENSSIVGDVKIGENSSVWPFTSMRADLNKIRVGKNSNIQDNCSIHVSPGKPVIIGDNVSIGHNAVIHGAKISDNVIVGMGAIIMDGVEIGENSIIGSGAMITEGKKIPEGSLALGSPAEVRSLDEDKYEMIKHNAEEYLKLSRMHQNR